MDPASSPTYFSQLYASIVTLTNGWLPFLGHSAHYQSLVGTLPVTRFSYILTKRLFNLPMSNCSSTNCYPRRPISGQISQCSTRYLSAGPRLRTLRQHTGLFDSSVIACNSYILSTDQSPLQQPPTCSPQVCLSSPPPLAPQQAGTAKQSV